MAKSRGQNTVETGSEPENTEAGTLIEGEQALDDVSDTTPVPAEGEDDAAKRPAVPKELRPLFNEIARLSSFLAIARRAIYNGQPERAAKALGLLERAMPDAREMADLSAS